MSLNHSVCLALFNLAGGEIILLFLICAGFIVVPLAVAGVVFPIVKAVANRPAYPVQTLPPEFQLQHQQARDHDHLRLLSIFHFVMGGLALFGVAGLVFQYGFMQAMLSSPNWRASNPSLPPQEFLPIFLGVYVFIGVLLLAALVLNVLSGLFLWHQRHRVFSLVVGALNCFQVPFGTALGIFTIVVLSRDSVRRLYCDPTPNLQSPGLHRA